MIQIILKFMIYYLKIEFKIWFQGFSCLRIISWDSNHTDLMTLPIRSFNKYKFLSISRTFLNLVVISVIYEWYIVNLKYILKLIKEQILH